MAIQHQVHDKFKVFMGDSITEVASQVQAFTSEGTTAAKSIGIEFIESGSKFLLSLGYAEGQDGYAVKVSEKSVGPLPSNEEADQLASALEAAASEAGDVICHELYVDADSIVHILFMERA